MSRLMLVFGTRPEAIKLAPVVQALRARPEHEALVTVTAQHREMLDQVLDLFGLVPDFDLDIMTPGQDLTEVTCAVLRGMRGVFEAFRPDLVRALRSSDPNVRQNVTWGIGRMGERAIEALPALVARLADEREMTRTNAASAIGSLEDKAKSTEPALTAALKVATPGARRSIAWALAKIRPGQSSTTVSREQIE